MVKNVRKEKYPQHHIPKRLQTKPNQTTQPHPIHKIEDKEDKHNNELPSPISNFYVTIKNDNKHQ